MTKCRIFLMSALAAGALVAMPARGQSLFSQNEDVIPPALDRSYTRAMQYLVKAQKEDGSWPNQVGVGADPAVAALCTLSILAHGEDPNSGPYHVTIHRAMDFLLKQQDDRTGYIGQTMYNHGFATLALAESYGMVDDPRLGPALQKAVDLILTSQSHNPAGAWRYSPESPDADTTVSGAQLVALFAARNAGIGVPEEAIQKALKFYADCQGGDGGIGYMTAGGPNSTRTSIGLLVFGLAKQQKTAVYKAALNYIKQNNGGGGEQYYQYYLYYASQAAFRAGPAIFDPWNAENVKALTNSQQQDGSWTGALGPSFSTAASLLSLALNYRLLPIYER